MVLKTLVRTEPVCYEPVITPCLNVHNYVCPVVGEQSTEGVPQTAQKRIRELELMQTKKSLYVRLQAKSDKNVKFFYRIPIIWRAGGHI